MSLYGREGYIRRRVAGWRQQIARLIRLGLARPRRRPDLDIIRANVDAFRAMSVGERMLMQDAKYGDLSEQSFLVEIIDDLRRQLAHAPTVPMGMPAVPGEPTPSTGFQVLAPKVLPDPPEDFHHFSAG
ncbi:MAG TPA: hypothetical protein VEL07_19195 [Planctomycetota bacterium]|nr:hypothetical protein [Planctomycetota bacterium]